MLLKKEKIYMKLFVGIENMDKRRFDYIHMWLGLIKAK